jgi:hypothetical protein
MNGRTASTIIFWLYFLIFAEMLSWETASWPGPCIVQASDVHEPADHGIQHQCPTFLAGVGILIERSDKFIEGHDKSIVAAFTVVLALSTIGLWLATARLWEAGERQIKVLERAVDVSTESAAAAKVSAEAAKDGAQASWDSADTAKLTMVARDRAYVHYNGCRWISHRRDQNDPVFWRISPAWFNGGNTPPRRLRVYAHYELLDTPLPQDYSFTPAEHQNTPAMLPPKGQLWSASRDVFGSDLLAVKEGKKHLYIWGTARYPDIFQDTPERITRFCVVATSVTGDPTVFWDEKTNKVDITFSTYHQHNCADEECDETH